MWTIDLAMILHYYGVSFQYYTITVGVNPTHKQRSFYSDSIEQDEDRVCKLFMEAQEKGISIVQRSVDLTQIKEWIYEQKPVIMLVDVMKMK